MLPTLYKCPSCWNEFHLEETLWISEELMGDTHFDNADENTRFLPKHFSAKECLARDSEGHACNRLACPHCHLEFPPFYLESQPFMTSIVGSQSSGKTCFLTSLYHWLQTELPNYGINYADGFAKNNERLDEIYKELFPQGSQQNKLVVPSATRLGENDVEIRIKKQNMEERVSYPRPFMYKMIPKNDNSIVYSLCFYDHAGERFWVKNINDLRKPVTQHIGDSDALFFLIDPTQIRRCVEAYKKEGNYVGAEKKLNESDNPENYPHKIFEAMATLIRNHSEMKLTDKYDRPIVIIAQKCDAWMHCLEEKSQVALKKFPHPPSERADLSKLNAQTINEVSLDVKKFLLHYCPEFVHTVEAFVSDAIYIPVSATGCNPTISEGEEGFIPGTLKPIWIGVPFLYALAKHEKQLAKIT